jgi:hypothetical protein
VNKAQIRKRLIGAVLEGTSMHEIPENLDRESGYLAHEFELHRAEADRNFNGWLLTTVLVGVLIGMIWCGGVA